MKNGCRVLLIEDLSSDAELAKREVKKVLQNAVFKVLETEEELLRSLETFRPEVIISDFKMPAFDGLSALRIVREKRPFMPFIILTGSMNEDTAVECMKAGADDYVIKEHIKRLGPAVQNSIKKKNMEIKHNEMLTALRESEERYRNLVENLGEGICVVDGKEHFLFANPAAHEIFGVEPGSLIGRNLEDFLDEDGAAFVRRQTAKRREGIPGTYELTISRPDSTKRQLIVTTVPRFEGNRLVETFSIFRDISERRYAEEERERLQSQLSQVQKMESIGRLAGGVAHDMNNLLVPVLGYGEMLLDALDTDDVQREPVEQIVNAGKRAKMLVNQLLTFSRRQTMRYEPADLNEIVTDFEKLLIRTIREDIGIRTDLWSEAVPVMADTGQIDQVIMNFAVNAADAMPGGGLLTVSTAVVDLDGENASVIGMKSAKYGVLQVADNGCGMDDETIEHLFEPFYSTKGEYGTGLGLSTVYGIVKQHGGSIRIQSERDRGTVFTVYLPLLEETSVKKESRGKQSEGPGGSETVLLVEDNDQVRKLASSILLRKGYTVISAENGVKALDELERHHGPVDLLLTDVVMPEMNGKDLYTRINQQYPDMKVLYMSGYTDEVIDHHGILDEGTDFISKPFTARMLVSRVQEVLNRSDEGP